MYTTWMNLQRTVLSEKANHKILDYMLYDSIYVTLCSMNILEMKDRLGMEGKQMGEMGVFTEAQ